MSGSPLAPQCRGNGRMPRRPVPRQGADSGGNGDVSAELIPPMSRRVYGEVCFAPSLEVQRSCKTFMCGSSSMFCVAYQKGFLPPLSPVALGVIHRTAEKVDVLGFPYPRSCINRCNRHARTP